MTRRILESLDDVGVESIVMPQTVGRCLQMRPKTGRPGHDRSYHSSEDFWFGVLNEKLVAERLVVLHRMRLFEWFPRNPGLFYTREAKEAASAGDGNATSSALKRLKPFGQKIIDVGEKIGVGLAVAAIKSTLGI